MILALVNIISRLNIEFVTITHKGLVYLPQGQNIDYCFTAYIFILSVICHSSVLTSLISRYGNEKIMYSDHFLFQQYPIRK